MVLKSFVVSWLALASLLLTPLVSGQLHRNSVIAKVANQVITSFDVQRESQRIEAALKQEVKGQEVEKRITALREQQALALIERELIWAEFQTLGIDVPNTMVQERINRIIVSRTGGDRYKFEELLEDENMTLEEFQEKVAKAVAVDMMMREHVGRHVRISPQDVATYYRVNQADFASSPRFRMQRIVLSKTDRGEDKVKALTALIYSELKKGTPFGELAKKYSDGPGKEDGGITDWLDPQDYKSLDPVLAPLGVGDVTPEPIETGSAINIIRLADRKTGGIPPLDADLKGRIEQLLASREELKRRRTYVQSLAKKHYLRIYDSGVQANFERDPERMFDTTE